MFTKRITLRPCILGFLISLSLCFGYLLFKTRTCHAEEKFLKFSGMCDASAGVSLDSARFIVSNDEDNILRVYMHGSQGIPVQQFNWESYLDITYDFENPEVDIEGATKIGDVIYWIGSHGRNKKGHIRPNRYRFFATKINKGSDNIEILPYGETYKNIIAELLRAPHLKSFAFNETIDLKHKKMKRLSPNIEGLNIEGLTITPEMDTLLIGFRNPRPNGMAMLLPLCHPDSILCHGIPARFGKPILLDLAGMGIRSIEYVRPLNKYLIVAGPHDDTKNFKYFTWSGSVIENPELWILPFSFNPMDVFTPEAFIIFPPTNKILLLSDDGNVEVITSGITHCKKRTNRGTCRCKDLIDPLDRSFKAIWVPLDSLK